MRLPKLPQYEASGIMTSDFLTPLSTRQCMTSLKSRMRELPRFTFYVLLLATACCYLLFGSFRNGSRSGLGNALISTVTETPAVLIDLSPLQGASLAASGRLFANGWWSRNRYPRVIAVSSVDAVHLDLLASVHAVNKKDSFAPWQQMCTPLSKAEVPVFLDALDCKTANAPATSCLVEKLTSSRLARLRETAQSSAVNLSYITSEFVNGDQGLPSAVLVRVPDSTRYPWAGQTWTQGEEEDISSGPNALKALPSLMSIVENMALGENQPRVAVRFRCETAADLEALKHVAKNTDVREWTLDCGMKDCSPVQEVAKSLRQSSGGSVSVRVRAGADAEPDLAPRTDSEKLRETLMLECGVDAELPCVPCPTCYAGSKGVCAERQAVHKNSGRKALKLAHLYKCPAGGPQFTWPIPDKDRMERLYQAYSGQARGLSLWHGRPVNQKKFIEKYVDVGKLENILEIGCAGGFLLGQFKHIAGIRMTCVEGDPDMEKAAKETLQGANFRLHRQMIESSEGRWEGKPLDLIMSSHVVEHVPEPCGLFKQFHSMLRHGGHMFHEIPCESVHQQGGELHMTFWTPDSIRLFLEQAGFEVVALRFVNMTTYETVPHNVSSTQGSSIGNVRVIARRA